MQEELTAVTAPSVVSAADTSGSLGDVFRSEFAEALSQVVAIVPRLLGAAVMILAGWVLAILARRFVALLAERLGLDRAAEGSGLAMVMQQAGMRRSIGQVVGAIAFWMLWCVFLAAACDILRLPGLADVLARVVGYLPRILAAAVVGVVGLSLSALARVVVVSRTEAVIHGHAGILGNVIYFVLVSVTVIGALAQLGIALELLNDVIRLAVGGTALALGLSLGLGGREVVAGLLCGYFLRQRFQAGDRVRIAGFEGSIREVGAVVTVIETEDEGLLHRHSIPNQRMLYEGIR